MKTPLDTPTQSPSCILNPDVVSQWAKETRAARPLSARAEFADRAARAKALLPNWEKLDSAGMPRAVKAVELWEIEAATP